LRFIPLLYPTSSHGAPQPDGSTRVFANATAWRSCEDVRLSALLRYMSGGMMEGDDFVSRVDEAVRSTRARPEWRRYRMNFEMYVYDRVKEGREKGLEEGREQGLEEGREQGIERGEERLASLLSALYDAGRADDAARALRDPDARAELYRELGIE
jgi:hypothetical protein